MSSVKDRIKHLYKVLGLTTVMAVSPTTTVSSTSSVTNQDDNKNKQELAMDSTVNQNFESYFENIMSSLDDTKDNVQELTEYISQQTMGTLRKQEIIGYDTFSDYQFTGEDFKKIQYGKMGKKIINSLVKKYHNQVPQGKCLAAVRVAVCGATGKNILAEPVNGRYLACNWPEAIKNFGDDAPLIYLGKVVVDKNGNDTGEGNIEKNDLLFLNGATVMSGGKQPAGHACFNKPIYDKNGEYVRTDARCDGNESLENILDNKVGGNGRRYGNSIQAFCMADDKPSPNMAKYLAQQAIQNAYENNERLVIKDGQIERYALDSENKNNKMFSDFTGYYAQALKQNSK